MADDRHYVPGDFYRIDDRSGFKVRAKKQRKEWTNLIVDQKLWESRQPQDFVKGVIDDQTVPEARPRPSQDIFVGPISTTILVRDLLLEGGFPLLLEGGNAGPLLLESGGPSQTTSVPSKLPPGATLIPVASTVGMKNGDTIQIMLDTNNFFNTTIVSIPSGTSVTIATPLPFFASTGNIVLDLTQSTNVALT